MYGKSSSGENVIMKQLRYRENFKSDGVEATKRGTRRSLLYLNFFLNHIYSAGQFIEVGPSVHSDDFDKPLIEGNRGQIMVQKHVPGM